MTPRLGGLALLVVLVVGLVLWWAARPAPPEPALRQLPRATGALLGTLGAQRAVLRRADAQTQAAANTARATAEQVRQVRTTRPLDLSAALVDTSHIRYVGALELSADALVGAAVALADRDAAFRALAAAHADSTLAHATRLDTLARAAVVEAKAAHGRGLKRGLTIGAVLGVALSLGFVLFTP